MYVYSLGLGKIPSEGVQYKAKNLVSPKKDHNFDHNFLCSNCDWWRKSSTAIIPCESLHKE